jgi:hypothetical protein
MERTCNVIFEAHSDLCVFDSKVCRNPGHHIARTNAFCPVSPNVCASTVRNVLPVNPLAPRALRWLGDFWEICVTLVLPFSVLRLLLTMCICVTKCYNCCLSLLYLFEECTISTSILSLSAVIVSVVLNLEFSARRNLLLLLIYKQHFLHSVSVRS